MRRHLSTLRVIELAAARSSTTVVKLETKSYVCEEGSGDFLKFEVACDIMHPE